VGSTNEDHWTTIGPDKQLAERLLDKLAQEATIGPELEGVAQAAAAFGLVGSCDTVLRTKIMARMAVLDSEPSTAETITETAQLGRAWYLIDRRYP
jgi:hypothetical protein